MGDKYNDDPVVAATPVQAQPAYPADDGTVKESGGGGGGGGGGPPGTGTFTDKEPMYAALGFFAFTLLIQSAYDCDDDSGSGTATGGSRSGGDCEDRWAYAVFCAVVGLVCVILHFIFTLATKLPCWDQFFEPFLVLALWIFWMIAAIVLTFPDHKSKDAIPYQVLGTGWVCTWASVAITTFMLYPSFTPAWEWAKGQCACLQNVGPAGGQSATLLLCVFLCSLAVMWCAADNCDKHDEADRDCEDEDAWAVACSCISLVYTLVLLTCGKLIGNVQDQVLKALSVGLALWWFCGIAVNTVVSPFWNTGGYINGFVGTWGAFGFAAWNAAAQFGMANAAA